MIKIEISHLTGHYLSQWSKENLFLCLILLRNLNDQADKLMNGCLQGSLHGGGLRMTNKKNLSRSWKAANFFQNQAETYQSRSNIGIWRLFRQHEASKILQMIGPVHGMAVLDLGTGSGYYARMFVELGAEKVYAVDLSCAMVRSLPITVNGTVGDIESCDLGRTFSKIICAGVLEFVENPVKVFENAHRHSQAGTCLVVLAPRTNIPGQIYKWYHRMHDVSVRLFPRTSLEKMASRAGWRAEIIKTTWPFSICASFRRIEDG